MIKKYIYNFFLVQVYCPESLGENLSDWTIDFFFIKISQHYVNVCEINFLVYNEIATNFFFVFGQLVDKGDPEEKS